MNTKHTPGPWVVGEEGFVERTGALDYVPVMKHNNGVVAFAYTNCLVKSDERCRANARLIAAAPDLLAALYVVTDAAEYMEFDPDSRFGEAVQRVREAIAKAMGEQA